jgi:4-alpha-glucanotransferase
MQAETQHDEERPSIRIPARSVHIPILAPFGAGRSSRRRDMRRQAGVVVPIFSIRTRRDWGIGQYTDLPRCADWILRAGQRLLQVLPPHELSAGEASPYGALTAFGLDPIYADIEAIDDLDTGAIAQALGREGERKLERVRSTDRVDYVEVRALKMTAFEAAFERFYRQEWMQRTPRATRLVDFARRERGWLDDLALYEAMRESHAGRGWRTWPEHVRDRTPAAIAQARAEDPARILKVSYVQWTLQEQWDSARRQMRDLGVELMGDLPFVVDIESADVWSHASQFQLPMSLGAPPDDFSADGQDWGLPPYDWLAMEANDSAWIRMRARRAAQLYDRFRLDHVVGYFRQWVRRRNRSDGNAPRDRGRFDPDGRDAQRARGLRVLGAMLGELSEAGGQVDPPRAIAEDLGVIPPFVREALVQLRMPGYRVLPWEKDDSGFRDPRSFPKESVVSWSTHDTAPIDAWWPDLPERDRELLAERAGMVEGDDADGSLPLLADMYRANSDLALVLAQEILGIKERINMPATVGPQNWTWRLPRPIEDLEADPAVVSRLDSIRALVRESDR